MTRGGIATLGALLVAAGCSLPPTACVGDGLTPAASSSQVAQVNSTADGLDINFNTLFIGRTAEQFFAIGEGCQAAQITSVTVTGSPELTLVVGADAGSEYSYDYYPYESPAADAIRFAPTTIGSFSATVTFTTTSRESPTLVFTVEGNSVAPGPACATDGECDGGSFCDGKYCEPNACGDFDNVPAWDAGAACAPESHSCPGPNGLLLTNTRSDPQNCGGCGQACPAGHGCAGGRCGVCSGYVIGPEQDYLVGTQSTPSGDSIYAFVLGDFDGDGYPDALVGADEGQYPGNAWLLINDGKGGFGAAPRPLSVCGSPFAVGDFNGDCVLDAVANITEMINDGHGNFPIRNVVLPVGTLSGRVEVVADLNQDGYPDLLGSSSLMLGDGRGEFRASPFVPTGWSAAAVADFNHDGRPDIEGAETSGNGTLFCYLNDGGGDLVLARDYFLPSAGALDPLSLAAAPLTGGAADLVYGRQGALTVLPNPAAGTGGATVLTLDAGLAALALTAADLDLDGHADLLASGSGIDGGFLELWTGFTGGGPDGGLLAGAFQTVFTRQVASFLQVSDVNGDGIPDIVAASAPGQGIPASPSTVMVFLGSCP